MISTNPFAELTQYFPGYAMQMFVLIMVALVVIGTIFDIIQDKDLKWMFLAFSDLLLICIFLADLRDDYDRCTDK